MTSGSKTPPGIADFLVQGVQGRLKVFEHGFLQFQGLSTVRFHFFPSRTVMINVFSRGYWYSRNVS